MSRKSPCPQSAQIFRRRTNGPKNSMLAWCDAEVIAEYRSKWLLIKKHWSSCGFLAWPIAKSPSLIRFIEVASLPVASESSDMWTMWTSVQPEALRLLILDRAPFKRLLSQFSMYFNVRYDPTSRSRRTSWWGSCKEKGQEAPQALHACMHWFNSAPELNSKGEMHGCGNSMQFL